MILETNRLILREMVLEDAPDMLRLHSNDRVQEFTGEDTITSLEQIRTKIKAIQSEDYENRGYGRWVTVLKNDKKFVGWAGLAYLPEFDEVDLGYRFLPEYWGAGIATEASQAILTYGFEVLQLKKIIAIAMKENQASIRVMEKIGMQFNKIAPYNSEIKDAVWYWCDQHHTTNK